MSEPTLAVLSAILPAVLLLCFIDKKDHLQHEPFQQIMKAFCMGMLAAICACFINSAEILLGLVNPQPTTLLGSMWISFFSAGLNEEALKLLFLWLFLRKNKYFDEHMDGIVYAAAVGMGFATLENLDYVLDGEGIWLFTAIGRGLFSVPGHFIFGVMMGYFFSLWYFRKERRYLRMAFFAPFVMHGVYDTIAFYVNGWFSIILTTILLSVLFVLGSRAIKKHLMNDLFTDQPTPTAEADGQVEEAVVIGEEGEDEPVVEETTAEETTTEQPTTENTDAEQ